MPKFDFSSMILFSDQDYLIVNKPPLVSSLEDRSSQVNMLKLAQSYDPQLMLCHRLDKETSGCLLFAKNEAAYRHAAIQFENRKVLKTYHAIVEGLHEWRGKVVDAPIMIQSNKVVISPKGKASKTIFNSVQLYKQHSLMECLPESGRMHQIRVHLAKEKAPIVNDELYGGHYFYLSSIKRSFKLGKYEEEQPLMKRFALHARGLSFEGISDRIVAEAPYPKDMRVLIKQLEQNR
jgi:23S rRNA pseudouridine955/2504/2580 synthase